MAAHRHAGAYAEESAEVEVLQANLSKIQSLSKRIESSLSRLETSGRAVGDAIGPVYGNTKRLQTMNGNVDRITAAIDRIQQPLDMRNREERILRSRPERVGLAEYVASMDRTNTALRELKASGLRSNQGAVAELHELLQVGTKSLEDVFRDLVRSDSAPIEPLGYIMKSSEFPRFAEGKSAQLRSIHTHIYNYASQAGGGELTPSARVYARERGQYVSVSLQNLAAASLSTARKTGADAVYKQGSNGIGTYARGLQGMYTAEYENICPVFSREEWGAVLSATCASSLGTFASTLRDLDAHVKQNLLTDCYLAFEILGLVAQTSSQLESRTGELKQPLADALKPVRETAKSSLAALLNDIRSRAQSTPTLPPDGAAVPLTADALQRLQLLTAYLPPVTSILRSLGAGGWSHPPNASASTAASLPTLKSFDVGADGAQLFAHYATDTIDTLLTTLDTRARVLLKGKALQGVFLANNVAVADRMVRNSDLSTLIGSAAGPKLDSWRKKASQMYTDAWKEASLFLLDVQHTSKTPRPPSTGQGVDSAAVLKSLSSKDRDGIKEKFKGFNACFEELVSRHKGLKMEGEVRRLLARDVQTFLEPLYARFWERYHEVDKGRGKYVRWDKAQLGAVLAGLG